MSPEDLKVFRFAWPTYGDYCARAYPMCRVAPMTLNMPIELRIPSWTGGERLRKAREDAGLTQQQLGEMISVSKRHIIKLENNQKTPTRGEYLLWQMMTRVPAEWLEHGHTGTGPDGNGGVTPLYRRKPQNTGAQKMRVRSTLAITAQRGAAA